MEKDLKKLNEELERIHSQLYIFYELAKAMRTTLRLEEITYIILTGLTAHEGLGFNRAAIFFTNEENETIYGFMGLGFLDSREAGAIWYSIEKEKKDLYSLIDNYTRIKNNETKPKFMEFVQSLSVPLNKEGGILFEILSEKKAVCFRENQTKAIKTDPLIQKLNLEEFIICPLWINDKPKGIIFVDNYVTKKPISNDDIKIFSMFVELASGAIKNSQAFESTLTKAHTDSLTSLWNYGYFQYKLDEELLKASAAKQPLSVMMFDLDDFKKFNDNYGHVQGDSALKAIGATLNDNCRKIDILCRYGGEEFALILPNSNKQEAALLGERIRKSVEESYFLNYKFTLSIGVSSFPEDASDKVRLIEKADQALYKAKERGKNKVELA